LRVSCEELFTTEIKRGEAATKGNHYLHHRGTEFAEFGIFLDQEIFTPHPELVLSDVEGCLGGAISEPCFTGEPEEPKNYSLVFMITMGV